MKIITVAVQKGGTGKTATALALAQAAAVKGKKTLLIDLDPQGNASFSAGAITGGKGSYEFLTGEPAAELIQGTAQGFDIIPASWSLSTITGGTGSARRLQEALKSISRHYDLVVIDTPPTAGELQYNALQAATGLIIPLQAEIYSLQSLYQIMDTAAQFKGSNPELEVLGFILTKFNSRSTIKKQMQENITNAAEQMGVPYLGAVRASVSVEEAAALQQSLFEYAPKSKPAAEYMAIFERLAVESGR